VFEGPGVRTPGFWGNLGKQFWDGIIANETKSGANFPGGELLAYNDLNGLAPGSANANPFIILGGDHDAVLEAGELKISLGDALKFINASQKQQQDGRWMLARDAVATELNIRAGNPGTDADPSTVDPQHLLDDAVSWLIGTTSDKSNVLTTTELTGGTHVGTSSSVWNSPYTYDADPGPLVNNVSIDHAASVLHTQLDRYNNTGFVFGFQFANDDNIL
jgi:hypothetical protein